MVVIETNTEILSKLILSQETQSRQRELTHEARRAFTDYLGCYAQGTFQKIPQKLAAQLKIQPFQLTVGQVLPGVTSENVALLNGFTAHYLDLDDVQGHFRGHPSAVIYSALLAVSQPDDQVSSLLWAYVEGVELAGKLGSLLNPSHALKGWHSTGTIGTIAATAAIGVLKQVSSQQLAQMLSLATTQAAGQLLQEGSDGKPLNTGFAARNAVTAYQLVKLGLSANPDPFNSATGWLKTISDQSFNIETITKNWFEPAEVKSPGLWFKPLPVCSAALSGFDAALNAWRAGVRFKNCEKIICHYPPTGDAALTQHQPQTGIAGKFSIEYIVGLTLAKGRLNSDDFDDHPIDTAFLSLLEKVSRQHDLPAGDVSTRPVRLEIVTSHHQSQFFDVQSPHGSPQTPLSDFEILEKAADGLGRSVTWLAKVLQEPTTTISALTEFLNTTVKELI